MFLLENKTKYKLLATTLQLQTVLSSNCVQPLRSFTCNDLMQLNTHVPRSVHRQLVFILSARLREAEKVVAKNYKNLGDSGKLVES